MQTKLERNKIESSKALKSGTVLRPQRQECLSSCLFLIFFNLYSFCQFANLLKSFCGLQECLKEQRDTDDSWQAARQKVTELCHGNQKESWICYGKIYLKQPAIYESSELHFYNSN